MLYPFETITEPSDDDSYAIPSGCGKAFPLNLESEERLNIIVVHTAMGVQDHSLRVWVSRQVGGAEVRFDPPNATYWHANRNAQEIVMAYDESLDRPEGYSIALEPGAYFVNVLNLINSANTFSFLLTEVD